MNTINVYNWLNNKLLNQLAKTCFLCKSLLPNTNSGLCWACLEDFPLNRHACARCGVKLPQSLTTFSTQQSPTYICGDCISSPPAWHTLTALCQYEYPVASMIQSLKYRAKFTNAKFLSRLFTSEFESSLKLQRPQCLLPVPLHPIRQRQRGFNQAIELARPIAKALAIPLDVMSCSRISNTHSQASLDQFARLQNLQNAFILTKNITYKHIAIFDDVVTTGSTIRSLCKLLYQAGIERVDVWCIARASKL